MLAEVLDALGAAPDVEVSEDFPTPLEVAGEGGPTSGGCASRVTSSSTGAWPITYSRARRRAPRRSARRSSAFKRGCRDR